MSINSLMNTAVSGLRASQSAIDTAGNNISNHDVPGYHRQKVLRAEEISTKTMPGFIGNGVVALDVNREYAEFVAKQLRSAQEKNSEANGFYQQIVHVDQMLSSKTGSIAVSIKEFFTSFEHVVNNARDIPSRHVVLNKAEGMVSRFVSASEVLRQQEEAIKRNIADNIVNVNHYAREIADLNNQIVRLLGTTGSQPNDLLDKRDHLSSELNKIVGVEILKQGDMYHVTFAGGLALVQGEIAYKITSMSSGRDSDHVAIGYDPGNGTPFEVNEHLVNGSLGGVLRFQTDGLDNARNKLGQLALVMAANVNKVNKGGFDLTVNTAGGDFFTTSAAPRVVTNTFNTGTATVTAAYNNTVSTVNSVMSSVMASNYELTFDGADWLVTRLSDKTNMGVLTPGTPIDGLDITITGAAANGDRFIIKPVSDVCGSLQLAITDPGKIAAGLAASLGAGNSAGVGDNRNAQNFLNLQNTQLIEERSTLMAAYAGLVADIGSQTSVAKIDLAAQGNMAGQLYAEQQKLSGVNLDEEYVNIQQLQHAYQANGKVIQIASSLFATLIEIVR